MKILDALNRIIPATKTRRREVDLLRERAVMDYPNIMVDGRRAHCNLKGCGKVLTRCTHRRNSRLSLGQRVDRARRKAKDKANRAA